MISLLLSGWLMIQPIPQPISNIEPIPIPDPKPYEFQVAPSQYELSWRNGLATAYYNGKDRMNGETGITASGYDLDNGYLYKGYRILASDRSIPFGTLIDIKLKDGEILHGVVLDRGGSVTGTHFDIVHRTKSECFQFGKQGVQWQEVGKIEVES